MATTRVRRAGANPSTPPAYQDGDRIVREEDYIVQRGAEEYPDEWEAATPVGWTGENALSDDAFRPDEEEELPLGDEWENLQEGFGPYVDEEYQPLFDGEDVYDDDLDPLDDEFLTDEERAELRRSNWQMISGLADFAGVILGTAAILLLVTLLVSLLNWLVNDLNQSFILLQKNF